MAKIIRPTYPLEFSIGMLILIFALSSFLSVEIFSLKWHDVMEGGTPLLGMVLAGIAVVIMALIVWEEFLFPVRIRPAGDEIIFRNHFAKLKTQLLIYSAIPIVVGLVYFNYEVDEIVFSVWAAICLVAPAGKLISGIQNYNDFLKISDDVIEYKNNEKKGRLTVNEIQKIVPIRDEANVLCKIEVLMSDGSQVTIDLDEMELNAFYHTIDEFIDAHYKALLK